MTIAVYTRTEKGAQDSRLISLTGTLEEKGCVLYRVRSSHDIKPGTDILLAGGGDGTFLEAATMVGDSGIPVAGINTGRLGFLSENRPEDLANALTSGTYTIERRALLQLCRPLPGLDWPYALNDVTVQRIGPSMLGIDVSIDGEALPTYWADGLIVATPSGSTAYSLAVGGPIVMPSSKVLLISPIAPHNLNIRPLVVSDASRIELSFRCREDKLTLTLDNRSVEITPDIPVPVSMAQFSLNRVRLGKSSFITALTSKLFWGEDIRNIH